MKPPITPPTKAPRIGTGMKVCPTNAPKIPEPKEAAVSIVVFPSYSTFFLKLENLLLKMA
jgi:hypothetical protein